MKRRFLTPWLLLTIGCPSAEPEPAPTAPESEIAVVSVLSFVREDPTGFSLGFDLDGLDTDDGDATGCGVEDFKHALTGAPGVDNGFAALLPVLDVTGGGQLGDLVQAAVNSGELLLILELTGLDSWDADECVTLDIGRGIGPPRIGGDERILPGQTFDRDLEAPASHVACAVATDGMIRGTPLQLGLPLNVFDETIDLTLLDGVIELARDEFGVITGTIGGAIEIQDLKDNVAGLDGIGDQIPALIGPLLDSNADLDGTGPCSRLSVTMTITAVSAFLFE